MRASPFHHLRGFLLGLLITVNASSCDSPTAPSPGSWTGTTAQGKPLTFEAADNSLTRFSVGYIIEGTFRNSFGSGTCTVEGTLTQTTTIPISAGAFRHEGSGTVATFSGNFDSSTSASGTVVFTETNASSCAGTATTTWTATKS